MQRFAKVNGAIFRYDIVDPQPSGWVFLHIITERPTIQGPDGKIPPTKTELVAGFPPYLSSYITFYCKEETNGTDQ